MACETLRKMEACEINQCFSDAPSWVKVLISKLAWYDKINDQLILKTCNTARPANVECPPSGATGIITDWDAIN